MVSLPYGPTPIHLIVPGAKDTTGMEEIGRTSIFVRSCLCWEISPQEQKSSSDTPVEGSVFWPLHLVFLSLGHYCKIVPGRADPDVCGDRVSVLLESGTRCPLGPVYGWCHVCSLDCCLTVRSRENPHVVKEILDFMNQQQQQQQQQAHTHSTIPLFTQLPSSAPSELALYHWTKRMVRISSTWSPTLLLIVRASPGPEEGTVLPFCYGSWCEIISFASYRIWRHHSSLSLLPFVSQEL